MTKTLTADDLVWAATARCQCGAGLAYPKGAAPVGGAWDCSAILLGEAIESGQPGAVQHTGRLLFAFYKVTSERNVQGRQTTRP